MSDRFDTLASVIRSTVTDRYTSLEEGLDRAWVLALVDIAEAVKGMKEEGINSAQLGALWDALDRFEESL